MNEIVFTTLYLISCFALGVSIEEKNILAVCGWLCVMVLLVFFN